MKKTVVYVLIIAVGIYALGHYVAYGSWVNNCTYTEEDIRVPQDLAVGTIALTRDAHQAIGVDPDYSCLPMLGKIRKQLVGPEMVTTNPIGWSNYYTRQGLTVADIPARKIFRVLQVLRITTHGISTIDAGSGPLDFLVLTDENGDLFKIATVETGLNKRDEFLSYTTPSASFMLDADLFISSSDAPHSFRFSMPSSARSDTR